MRSWTELDQVIRHEPLALDADNCTRDEAACQLGDLDNAS